MKQYVIEVYCKIAHGIVATIWVETEEDAKEVVEEWLDKYNEISVWEARQIKMGGTTYE